MEAIFFLLLFVVAFYLTFHRKRKSHKGKTRYRTTTKANTAATVLRFDSKSSKPQKSESILKGSAHIVDGDTLVVQKTQIRLFGIDAPEINHPYGQKAKWALVSLCKGQSVTAEITERDAYGRTVAKCFLSDGRDLSAEMVKLGLAIDWPKYSGGKFSSLEVPNIRKKLWLADARQKGRMYVWKKYEAEQNSRTTDK